MGLLRIALIFGAGYALGRPEGRRKIAELAQRPEVKQAREQAVSTVSSGFETGKQRLTGKVSQVTDKNKKPSFPEPGARPDGPSVPAADVAPSTGTRAGTAANATSPGTTSPGTTSPSTTSPSTTSTSTGTGISSGAASGTGTSGTGTSGTKPGTAPANPDVPSTPPSSTR